MPEPCSVAPHDPNTEAGWPSPASALNRRSLIKRSFALGGLAGVSACAPGSTRLWSKPPLLLPYRASVDRIVDVRCCLRPFRPMGPRLEVETVADKLVVHNYGHGGSGWSLSWGSADIAVEKAKSVLPDRVAVVGCGIIGLTSAITAQRQGLKVTIYTRDLLPRTRSVRANGSWTPSSRIALTAPAGTAFARMWERMARFSWKTYGSYLGLAGRPVEFCDHYILADDGAERRPASSGEPERGDYASSGMPQSNAEFADYSHRIADLTAPPRRLTGRDNPFATGSAELGSILFFNFASYGSRLMSEFREAGGRIEIREFHAPADLATLPEKVIINCPGYSARDWWKDKTLIPVRGQTGWLVPQPEVGYGLIYRGVQVLPKSDGVMVQNFDPRGLGDLYGVGDSAEIPERADTESAVRTIGDLFARIPRRGWRG